MILWPLFVLLFYIICNIKNILTTFRAGRVSLKSIIVLILLIGIFITLISLPSFVASIIGNIIVSIMGIIFSIIDILLLVSTAHFDFIEIFDFIVAFGSVIGLVISMFTNS